MKNGLRPWIAGQPEKKAALVVASASLLLVGMAFLWPWIDNETNSASSTEVVTQEKAPAPALSPEIVKPAKPAEQPAPPPAKPEAAPVKPPEPVAKKTKPTPTPVSEVAPDTKNSIAIEAGYYVQLGAFKDTKRADALAGRLSGKWKTHIVDRPNKLQAVWVGPYASSKLAEQEKLRIAKAEKINGFIIKH